MEEALQGLLDRVEGAFAAGLGTLEGLLVEGVRRRRVDLEAAIAEHAALLRQARSAYAGSLGSPRVEELLVGGHPVVGYARMLGPSSREELFLLLLLSPEANLGRARLEAAKTAGRLLEVVGWPT
ncbi:hypothetical protein GCM10007092_08260 [Thermus composti]|uniref:Roadblock/LAMTOR2 domain-containing protein n=1 Tax=Thermus composti TaxID=532059 RepID=A0ABV6PXM5_9DEIN|nr:hypothetical protein [Thermus composti]GGM96919.1 hypothetical protein GCM10007092_08260 [Thermus composti]